MPLSSFSSVCSTIWLFPGWSYATYQTYLTEIAINVGLTLSVFHYAGLYDCNTIVSWPSRMRQMVLLSALVTLILLTLALALAHLRPVLADVVLRQLPYVLGADLQPARRRASC